MTDAQNSGAVEAAKAAQVHLALMTNQMRQFVEPSGYTAFDRKSIAFESDREAKARMFINDMIYLLDGPEQRELASKIETALSTPAPSDQAGWQDALTGCVGIESSGGNGGHPWVRVSFTEPGQEAALHSLLAELLSTTPTLTAGGGGVS